MIVKWIRAAARYTWAAWTGEGGCPHMGCGGVVDSLGAEAPTFLWLYAALKRRSYTVVQACVVAALATVVAWLRPDTPGPLGQPRAAVPT
jgi:hypothetical protein